MNLLPIRFASLLALCLGASLSSSAAVTNLVQDPGFESAAGTAGSLTSYSAGQSFDGGLWTVNTFAFVDKQANHPVSGSVGLFMLSGSSVSQSLTTAAGQVYTISFDAYGAPSTSTQAATTFGGVTNTSTVLGTTSTSPASPITHVSFNATATGTSTLLTFANSSGIPYELDNVSVQAVPEPSAIAALGLGALGLLRRRKRA